MIDMDDIYDIEPIDILKIVVGGIVGFAILFITSLLS
jgi:hypothetical protein